MNRRSNSHSAWTAALVLVTAWVTAAPLPPAWQREQAFTVNNPGLIKISLPVETLDAARPGLEDLRVYDEAGNELPYFLERPQTPASVSKAAAAFDVSLTGAATVIQIDSGFTSPLEAVTLQIAAGNFIKPVQIETSPDGKAWKLVAQGRPIFREERGLSQLRLEVPSPGGRWVRLTVDDRRSPPIPIVGVTVHTMGGETPAHEMSPVTIRERHENPGETRLVLDLGGANLDLTSLHLETTEPLFTREFVLAVPEIREETVQEQVIGRGVIYRVAVEGQPVSAELSLPLERPVRGRELRLIIRNYDSPPLPITAVRAERRPAYAVFLARINGTHHLLVGNPHSAAPRYDLAALGGNLRGTPPLAVTFAPLGWNSNYQSPEVLPGLEVQGAPLVMTPWKYRKALAVTNGGAQQLELDLDVLAQAQPDLADLRLMRGSNQVPYLLERTALARSVPPTVTAGSDPKDARRSVWTLKLPQGRLPITRLSCTTRSPLFERALTLYEDVPDDRGQTYQRSLGNATWVQTPQSKNRELVLVLIATPTGDTLHLATHNGDNPALILEDFRCSYTATRLLFKAEAGEDLFLYYNHPEIGPPRYDLSLVANQLLAARRSNAALGPEEMLRKTSWREGQSAGKGGVVFWGILAVVVVGLLAVMARLLPKAQTQQ